MTDFSALARSLDLTDPLARFREQFELRDGLVYLDGNSLGALPRATAARMAQAISADWGDGLITSWNEAGWIDAPRRIGDKIGRLIGAKPGEVIATDSTSVNIFKALTAALSLRPGRPVMLTEAGDFPTDQYMMQGIEAFSEGRVRTLACPPDELMDRLGDDVAVLLLTQVHYKTGSVRNMAEVTQRAHAAGVLVVWDLSHSAGAIEVDLRAANADFAVGCGYKYLNGGPGAPAYLYAASRHHGASPVLSGWFGHARPFGFEEAYSPADGIERFLCGTPSILGLVALESGVDLLLQADMAELRRKSVQLSELFIGCMADRCGAFGFHLLSPPDPELRGSQISYSHPDGYAIVQALKAADVIGDFRIPDVLRFGLTPLYLRHIDVVTAVDRLAEICRSRSWDQPQFHNRATVT